MIANKKRIYMLITSIIFLSYLFAYIFRNKNAKPSLKSSPNEYILAYVNLPLDYYNGSSSIPLTLAALSSPPGDFLEVGMSLFSTPLLHKIAKDQNRNLVSIDTDLELINKFVLYNMTKSHKLYNISDDLNALTNYSRKRDWALVFIDQSRIMQRPQSKIALFAQKAQIVVLHDNEKQSSKITEYFSYVCTFTLFRPPEDSSNVSTSLMSNFIDLKAILTPVFQKVITEYGQFTACDRSL